MTISPIRGRAPTKRTITKFGMRGRVADCDGSNKLMYNTIIQFFPFTSRNSIYTPCVLDTSLHHPASTLCVSEPSQVHPPTVRPFSSLVSNRHDTCPESRRRVQSTVTKMFSITWYIVSVADWPAGKPRDFSVGTCFKKVFWPPAVHANLFH